LLSVGVNCALGAREMRPYLAELAEAAPVFITCYPNAGLPNAFGEYDEVPETTAALLREFAESNLVNMLGGCCGTTPDHVRQIAAAVKGLPPRVPQAADEASAGYSRFSGLETLTIRPETNFLMVGERPNITGSSRFADMVKAGDWTRAAEVAL